MDTTSKRERPDSAARNAGDSKRRKEMDSFQPVIRSKAKPCTGFFSTSGCPYGDGCHYLHYFPGGLQAVQQMAGLSNPFAPVLKLRICNEYHTTEGCKFGERCNFAHGRHELGKPVVSSSHAPIAAPPSSGGGQPGLRVHLIPLTSKMSVDASIVGLVVGEGGVNTENICQLTGARLSIQAHESDLNLKNIELEGTYDQINPASEMVRDLINNVTACTAKLPVRNPALAARSNSKTNICNYFRDMGFCSYGNRCRFAHGESELQKGPS